MSIDLERELRAYAEYLDEYVALIRSADGDVIVAAGSGSTDRRRAGWLVAAAIGLVVLVVSVVVLANRDSAPFVTETPTSTTTATPSSADGPVFPRGSVVLDLATSDGLVVAVGGTLGPRCCGTGVDGELPEESAAWTSSAAVWTSPDGQSWARVGHDESVFGGEGLQLMTAVAAADGG